VPPIFGPLKWLVAIASASLLIAQYENAPAWVMILCGAVYALTALVYLGVYFFFLRKLKYDLEIVRTGKVGTGKLPA
jgi:membrane protein YdbS with pleckstrin-like domain